MTEQSPPHPATLGDPPEAAVVSLPCLAVAAIEPRPAEERWLIEGAWASEGVGLIGGSPKVGKSWFALDLALSVASGTPALGRFNVPVAGPVVVFPAEDGPQGVRTRIEALARGRGVAIENLPLFVITSDSLLLDEARDRAGIEDLLLRVRPKLVVLDPLVRLHTGDENHAGHVADLLGYLRRLQRRFGVAIIVTHHISKKAGVHPGQALRGSGDLHAWGDSNAYLQRKKDGGIMLTFEHRFAPSPDPLWVRLETSPDDSVRLAARPHDDDGGGERHVSASRTVTTDLVALPQRVLAVLRAAERPMSQVAIRRTLRVRNAELTAALRSLQGEGLVESLGRMGGWRLRPSSETTAEAHASEAAL